MAHQSLTKQPVQPPPTLPAVSSLTYDSGHLIRALVSLSQDEIERMLDAVASLEAPIANLTTAGEADPMLRIVSEGLTMLSYLLDAVKQHHADVYDAAGSTSLL